MAVLRTIPIRRISPVCLLLIVVLFAAACGSNRDGVPEGAPDEIIRSAPAKTRGEGTARVALSVGRIERTALVDLSSPGAGDEIAVLVDGLLDELASPVKVTSFGGQQVRGIPAFRYDVVLQRAGDREITGVWVDSAGRIRRIQVRTLPKTTVPGGLPNLTIVDFVGFDVDQSSGGS